MAFNDKSLYFRAVFLLLLAYLLAIAAIAVYRFTSAVTDENIFVTNPARLMVRKTIAARLIKVTSKSQVGVKEESPADSLRAGYLVVRINDERVENLAQMQELIRQGRERGRITFSVPFGPALYTYETLPELVEEDFFMWLPPSVVVVDVAKDGASDRAGMRVGDIIYKINGQAFTDARSADFILRSHLPGKTLEYDIYRGPKPMTLKVVLARFGAPVAIIVLILSGFIFLVVGAFIALTRPTLKPARLLGLAMSLIGFFLCVVMSRRDVLPSFFTVLRDGTMNVSLLFGSALFYHASIYFPQELTALSRKRWPVRVGYLLAAIGSLVMLVFPRQPLVFTILLLLGVFTAATFFIHRKQIPAEYKRMSRALKIARAATLLATIVILLGALTGPPANRFRVGYIGLPLLLIPLAYLYTIGRYHLLNMDLRIRRNIQYNLLAAVWFVGVVAVWVAAFMMLLHLQVDVPKFTLTSRSVEVIDEPLSGAEKVATDRALVIVAGIGVFWVLRQIYRYGRVFLNRQFDRSVYDYRRLATNLAEVLAAKSNLQDLANNLLFYLLKVMRLKRLGVMLINDADRAPITAVEGIEASTWQDFIAAFTPRLLRICAASPGQTRFRSDYLPVGDKELVRTQNLAFIVPLRSGEKILGAILAGEKLAETPYQEEDLELLVAAARQAVVAVENTLLYEELGRRERLRHELELARRIQLSSLPQKTPTVAGLDIAASSVPAMEVGGDYFDYFSGHDDSLTIIIGDVSGKGISASLYMSKMQGILRSLHGFNLSPRELFIRANAILSQDIEKQYFITALGARIERQAKKMTVTRAGHLPLFYYRAATHTCECITPKGIGFGLDDHFSAELEQMTIYLERDDVIVLVTDGITEARNKNGDEFGEERLFHIVQNTAAHSAQRICNAINEAVKIFSRHAEQYDDQTLVVVKVMGEK